MATLFLGSTICEVDSEGNVPIPEFLSEALDSTPDDSELLVSRHEADTCLIGYGHSHLRRLRRSTERRRRADERAGRDPRGHHRRTRRTFGSVERMARAPGTMRIPPAMRRMGRIEGLALIVGTGDNFEIWNPDLAIASGDDSVRDLAAFRMKAREQDAATPSGAQ